ncbi:MAG TPA: malate dehydrogenase [Candidatus Baltobacteraceae bacterium]|jgi:malate dehydrogenase|nr:malate dehydrogenase [Candidatus Baltobacteraceae bacterium]
MTKTPIRVAVTGAAGAIGYSILSRISSGELFGPDQPVVLHLVDIPDAVPALRGVMMELEDCASPALKKLTATSDLAEGFDGINWALLIGSVSRKPGMERKDLLAINGKIFTGQGQALQKYAARDVRILVVGNPCNTNCLIARHSAPEIPASRWFAMTRLDENRGKAQLAKKAGVHIGAVSNLAIWGNHSPTMFPDFYHAKINGKPLQESISDENWLKTDFVTTVAQRGTSVLNARKAGSAASAAHAALDTVKSIVTPTPAGDWHSVCVCSDGSYGIDKGLICSFPVRSDGQNLHIVPGLDLNEFARGKIDASVNELQAEKAIASELGLVS